jgi:hypothetical protein
MVADVERIGIENIAESRTGANGMALERLMCQAICVKCGRVQERNGQIGKEDWRQMANERARAEVALRHKA